MYEVLRRDLMGGRLEPLQLLRVQDLADQLGVSKTPIHNALNRLVTEGLLESLPRGFQVRRFSKKEALDTYTVRCNLECLSARLAAENITPAGADRLRGLLTAIDRNPPTDFVAHIEADLSLHNALAELSGNEALADLTRQLTSRMIGFRVATRDENTNLITRAQHEDIVEAVAGGKGAAAERAMQTHIRFFADLLAERLTEEHYVA